MYKYFVIMNLPDLNNLNLILFYSSCIPQHEGKYIVVSSHLITAVEQPAFSTFLISALERLTLKKKQKKTDSTITTLIG